MKELEMIKAFAELEGLRFNDDDCRNDGSIWINCYDWYNPITDLALSFKAMVDYEVVVDYIRVDNVRGVVNIIGCDYALFSNSSELPHAIIEVILKSKGLWND